MAHDQLPSPTPHGVPFPRDTCRHSQSAWHGREAHMTAGATAAPRQRRRARRRHPALPRTGWPWHRLPRGPPEKRLGQGTGRVPVPTGRTGQRRGGSAGRGPGHGRLCLVSSGASWGARAVLLPPPVANAYVHALQSQMYGRPNDASVRRHRQAGSWSAARRRHAAARGQPISRPCHVLGRRPPVGRPDR